MASIAPQLETIPDWQKCLATAIDCREQLHEAARREQNAGAPYLRPLVLIQAQPRRAGMETLDVAAVKKELMENHRIPGEKIVIATGGSAVWSGWSRTTRTAFSRPIARCVSSSPSRRWRKAGTAPAPTFW